MLIGSPVDIIEVSTSQSVFRYNVVSAGNVKTGANVSRMAMICTPVAMFPH